MGEVSALPSPQSLAGATDAERLAYVREFLTDNVKGRVDRAEVRLAQIEALIDGDDALAERLGKVLPKALDDAYRPKVRTDLDAALGRPWVGAASHAAIHQLPAATEALAPMMLPAISQAVKERLASFNRALQRASPTRRIGWKIKSLRTGLPLETVIEQDMDPFRVHRILAVEVPAGHLLASHRVTAPGATAPLDQEEEAFASAALLTAIRGFVRDARIGEASGELTSIEIGNRRLHIAQQGNMMVAVEASGQMDHDLNSAIDAELFPALRTTQAQDVRERILASWHSDRDLSRGIGRRTGLSGMIAVFALVGLALWGAHRWMEDIDMGKTRDRLLELPGVASARIARGSDGWAINVAADPMAQLESAFDKTLQPRDKIHIHVERFLALDHITLARALQESLPPDTRARVTVTKEAVFVDGAPSDAYIEAVRQHPRVKLAGLPVVARGVVSGETPQ